jgi:hypothetical protein
VSKIQVEELDAQALKKMLVSLEKKITHNQLLRTKFGDDPEK